MRKTLLILLFLPAVAMQAQQSPIGRWNTFDAGKPKGIVEIHQARDGSFAGRVVEVLDLREGPNPLCVACRGVIGTSRSSA